MIGRHALHTWRTFLVGYQVGEKGLIQTFWSCKSNNPNRLRKIVLLRSLFFFNFLSVSLSSTSLPSSPSAIDETEPQRKKQEEENGRSSRSGNMQWELEREGEGEGEFNVFYSTEFGNFGSKSSNFVQVRVILINKFVLHEQNSNSMCHITTSSSFYTLDSNPIYLVQYTKIFILKLHWQFRAVDLAYSYPSPPILTTANPNDFDPPIFFNIKLKLVPTRKLKCFYSTKDL